MHRRAFGPEAWLVADVADPPSWAAGLHAAAVRGVVEVVPAEDSVLVACERAHHDAVGTAIDGVTPARSTEASGSVTIHVHYDGADLQAVAELVGLAPAEVIERHKGATYTVAFCGFSPGFAYLRGLPDRLHVPRRERPRTAVPAGSVAIAAHYSAVYPSPSPGGWHLLGHTDDVVWDAEVADPAVLVPGTSVRFEAI